MATPIKNSHPVTGSNKTNRIPTPNPMQQTPIVFFKNFNFIPPFF